jgi:hypothetical protein
MKMAKVISHIRILVTVLSAVLSASACTTISEPLDIYFVDVEGGQATLIITPRRRDPAD